MFFVRKNRPYQKVLLLSMARSGTNILRSLLNSHRSILMHGEILNFHLRMRHTGWPDRPNYHLNIHEDTCKFFLDNVFPQNPGRFSTVGFKLFMHQLNNSEQFSQMYNVLNDMSELRIIYLVRENILDKALSLSVAERDNRFTLKDGLQRPPHTIHIPFSALMRTMTNVENEQKEAETAFRNHDRHRLTFEALTKDTDSTMASLLDWLGEKRQPLQRRFMIQRQRIVPKREALLNFEELREKTAAVRPDWLRFFDEDPEELPTIHSALETVCAS